DKEQIRQMFQMAWTFVNDSYCTTLCLQWEPEIIAIAVMYLACKLSKFEITDWANKKENTKQKWWEQFVEGLTKDIIEDICHQHLDLYSKNNTSTFGAIGISGGNSQSSSANVPPLSNTNTWTINQGNSNIISPVIGEATPNTPVKRPIRSDDDSYRNIRSHTSAEQASSRTPTITTDGRSSVKNEHDLATAHIKQPMPSSLTSHPDDSSRRTLAAPSMMMNAIPTQQQTTQQNQVSPSIWMNMRPPAVPPSLLSMPNPFMPTHFPPFPPPPPLPLPPVPSFETPKYHQSK
ncbi:unnamed protein product, partial [Didymodactylos carnosus]